MKHIFIWIIVFFVCSYNGQMKSMMETIKEDPRITATREICSLIQAFHHLEKDKNAAEQSPALGRCLYCIHQDIQQKAAYMAMIKTQVYDLSVYLNRFSTPPDLAQFIFLYDAGHKKIANITLSIEDSTCSLQELELFKEHFLKHGRLPIQQPSIIQNLPIEVWAQWDRVADIVASTQLQRQQKQLPSQETPWKEYFEQTNVILAGEKFWEI